MIDFIVSAFLYILPAYIANSGAALFGGGTPIDFGRKMRDGHRILGDGKSWRGLAVGIFFGAVAGYVIGYLTQLTPYAALNLEKYALLGVLLSAGAMVGDLTGSFIKRRLGMERGAAFPLLDQLDFLIGAILFGAPIYLPGFLTILFLVIATPGIHLFLNYMGYKLKCKRVPW